MTAMTLAERAASLHDDDREGVPLEMFAWAWHRYSYAEVRDGWLEYAALRRAGDEDVAETVLGVLLYGPEHGRAAA